MAKDYAAIARQCITNPKLSVRQPRIFVYGRNKRGKTHFCTTAPNVLVLDPEDGTSEEVRRNPDTWPVRRWDDLADAAGFLRSKSNQSPLTGKPYEWCAIDGCTRLSQMALNFVRNLDMQKDLSRKPTDTKIQDWGRANKMMEEAVHQFHALRDIGLIFTAQERMVEIANMDDMSDDDETTPTAYQYVPDLPKGARAPFNQVVDVIGRIYVVRGEFTTVKRVRNAAGNVVKKEVPTTKERRLWIGPHDMYDTGYRSDHDLPDFLLRPTVPSVVGAIQQGKV